MQVGGALDQLLSLLQGAVDRTSWVDEFGMTADFGIGDLQNPYVRICRAECMLAALLLHVEGSDVNFLDDERLEVLRDAPTSARSRKPPSPEIML